MENVPELPEAGERQPQGIPALDVWMMESINQAKQQLGEGQRIDPWFVSDLFLTYHEKITREMMNVRGIENAVEEVWDTETPAEIAFKKSLRRLQDAYDIVAYPFYTVGQQQMISNNVHDIQNSHRKSQQPFTLNSGEKATLQSITRAIGFPDNPQQVTYSFSSIPPAPKIVDAKR